MSEIGSRIKQSRIEHEMTQAQLAEVLHVTRQTISNWENGRSVPDYVMLEQLSNILPLNVKPLSHQNAAELPQPAKVLQNVDTSPSKKSFFHRRCFLRASMALLLISIAVVIWITVPKQVSPYTVAWFSQQPVRRDGQAHIRTYSPESPVHARQHRPEATPIYQCSVFMKEENGIGCSIQEITLVYFKGQNVLLIDSLAPQDFLTINLGTDYIGANEYRRMSINMPAGAETGIGFWIRGVDDAGHTFESRYYLPMEK